MSTVHEAYRVWAKKYPTWKSERPININGSTLGYVLMDSNTCQRKILVYVRCEIPSTLSPIEQSVTVPQTIVDGLSFKKDAPPIVIAFRGKFFQVSASAIAEHKFTKREAVNDEKMYRFVLQHVGAWDITESMARAEQQAIEFEPSHGETKP